MRRMTVLVFTGSLALLLSSGCASGGGAVDESARLIGRESDVRVDAMVRNLNIGFGSNVSIRYDVENLRTEPIAVADIVPEVVFDTDTGLITVMLGSEVPGNEFLPRLVMIRSGEKQSFSAGVNLNVGSTVRISPSAIRIRLSYLKDVEPFESLIGITQKAVHDPELADEMFLPWVESVRFVDTNSVPLQWTGRSRGDAASPVRGPRIRPPGAPD